jgi:hypothetical protein
LYINYKVIIFTKTLKQYIMKFIVIEKWENLPAPYVCTTEEGEGLYFDTYPEAEDYAKENCQEGLVVPLDQTPIDVGIYMTNN